MIDPRPKQVKSQRQIAALVTLISLVICAAAGNLIITRLFVGFRGPGPFYSYSIFMGLLLAQPCLLSIWCAWGSGNSALRIFSSMGVLAGLTLVYMNAFVNGKPMVIEIVLIFAGAALMATTIIQVPLWIYRKFTKRSLRLRNHAIPESTSSQFSIKQLLIAMTVAAIVVTGTKALLPELNDNRGPGFIPWMQIISVLLFFAVTICLTSFVVLAFVFSPRKHKLAFFVLLVLFFSIAPWGTSWIVSNSFPFLRAGTPWTLLDTAKMFIFFWSVGLTLTTVLSLFYLIGFRLEENST
jgi:hypothetical protein